MGRAIEKEQRAVTLHSRVYGKKEKQDFDRNRKKKSNPKPMT